jgi:hypothetical protein
LFAATAVYLIASPFSNATVNVVVSSSSNNTSDLLNSQMVQQISQTGLNESDISTLTVTFVPLTGGFPSRFDIEEIVLTVADPTYVLTILSSRKGTLNSMYT